MNQELDYILEVKFEEQILKDSDIESTKYSNIDWSPKVDVPILNGIKDNMQYQN